MKKLLPLKQWDTWGIRLVFLFYLGLGLLGFARLLPAINQPFGGFIWLRDDVHGFSVGFESGRSWAGRQAGLELEDRILRIQGREIPLNGKPDVASEVYRHAEPGQLIEYEIERQGEIKPIQVPVTRFTWGYLFESYLTFYAAALAIWGIGLFVHLVSSRAPASNAFALMCLALSVLLAAHNFSGFAHKFFDARWTTFIVFAPVWPLLNAFIIHFASIFPQPRPWWPKIRPWVYGAALALGAAYSYSFASWGDPRLSDPMLIATVAYSVLACLYGIALFVFAYLRSSSLRVRQQVRIIGLGVGLGGLVPFLSMSTYILFRPYSNVPWSPANLVGRRLISDWLMPLPFQLSIAAVTYTFFVAVAILRYRAFGAKPATIKAITITVLVGALILTYTLAINGLQALFGYLNVDRVFSQLEGEGFDWMWVSNILATLVTAALFTPLRDRIYQGTVRLLYPYRITVSEALERLIEAIQQADRPSATDAEIEIPQILTRTLKDLLYLQDAFIWFYFPATGELQLVGRQDVQPGHLPLNKDVLHQLIQAGSPVDLAAAPALEPLYLALAGLDVRVCLPLVYRGRELVGLVGLGPRRDEVPFSSEDRSLFAHLTEYLLLLLKNVRTIRALQGSRERVSVVQEAERQRIAQDLHDETLSYLSYLATVKLELCKRAAPDSQQAVQLIQETQEETRQAAANLRSMLSDISPTIISHRGLVSALESLVSAERNRLDTQAPFEPAQDKAQGKPDIALHIAGYTNQMLPERYELGLFRCIQEALRNAIKHAQAHKVNIHLQCENGRLVATVQDDGVGFNVEQVGEALRQGHLGLQNMRDRIETLEGELVLESNPGRGTTVRIEIPLPLAGRKVDR